MLYRHSFVFATAFTNYLSSKAGISISLNIPTEACKTLSMDSIMKVALDIRYRLRIGQYYTPAPPTWYMEEDIIDTVVRSIYFFWSMAMHSADLSLLAQLNDGNVNEELFLSVR
jgi:hypothetical protein